MRAGTYSALHGAGRIMSRTIAEKTIDEAPVACIEITKKPGNKCKYLLSFYI